MACDKHAALVPVQVLDGDPSGGSNNSCRTRADRVQSCQDDFRNALL